ncbi:MAG TPA: STAS domain-containing protein [Vicinamibacterales bacterium]|nr:STAS domain-containing protein [Vicinamibacterales bacterium]
MTITEREIGDVTILELEGRLVLYEGESDLKARINELIGRGRVRIVLDMERVNYIDSAGVGMVIAKYLSLRRRGGDLKLLNLTDRSMRVMSITRLLDVFDTFDSVGAAVASFEAQEPGPASGTPSPNRPS